MLNHKGLVKDYVGGSSSERALLLAQTKF